MSNVYCGSKMNSQSTEKSDLVNKKREMVISNLKKTIMILNNTLEQVNALIEQQETSSNMNSKILLTERSVCEARGKFFNDRLEVLVKEWNWSSSCSTNFTGSFGSGVFTSNNNNKNQNKNNKNNKKPGAKSVGGATSSISSTTPKHYKNKDNFTFSNNSLSRFTDKDDLCVSNEFLSVSSSTLKLSKDDDNNKNKDSHQTMEEYSYSSSNEDDSEGLENKGTIYLLDSKNSTTAESNKMKINNPKQGHFYFIVPPNSFYTMKTDPSFTLYELIEPLLFSLQINPESLVPVYQDTKELIDWGIASTRFESRIIQFYFLTENYTHLPISHKFKNFSRSSTKFCNHCNKQAKTGLVCKTCMLVFHPNCYSDRPTLCEGIFNDSFENNNNNNDVSAFVNKERVVNSQSTGSVDQANDETNNDNRVNDHSSCTNSGPRRSPKKIDETHQKSSSSKRTTIYEGAKFLTRHLMRKIGRQQKVGSNNSNTDNEVQIQCDNSQMTVHFKTVNYSPDDMFRKYDLNENKDCSNNENSDVSVKNYTDGSSPIILTDDTETDEFKKNTFRRRSNNPVQKRLARGKMIKTVAASEWEIDINEVKKYEKVGAGAYGTVYRGYWHGDVAIKEVSVANPTNEIVESFKNEVAILRLTRHDNIVLFMGYCLENNRFAIITQWCEGSSLYSHLHVKETKFRHFKLLDIMLQAAHGMSYLHGRNIIHRDLKSNNILLQGSKAKICDFGLATLKTMNKCEANQPTGSILWMAPEVIRMDSDSPYTVLADVYSYGIVLYEVMSTSLPYSNISNKDQILYMVGKGYLRPNKAKIKTYVGRKLIELYDECVAFDPGLRPDFEKIVKVMTEYRSLLPNLTRTTSDYQVNSRLPY